MLNSTPFLTDTVTEMTTDVFVFMPLVVKEPCCWLIDQSLNRKE
jgi:hypothetical protein